jgi:hypothetical protein
MVRRYENRSKIEEGLGPMGLLGHVLWFLSLIFAVIGIIGEIFNINALLVPMSWYLLGIVMVLLSIPFSTLAGQLHGIFETSKRIK